MRLERCSVLVSCCVGCFVGSLERDVDLGILFPRPDSSDRVVLSCARGLTRGIVTAFLRCSVLEVLSSRTVHHS